MCNFSEKVVAWLDGELPADMAAELELHVGACLECASRMNDCKRISAAVKSYCETRGSVNPRRALPLKSLAIAAAAVAALAIFLARPHSRAVQPAPLPAPASNPAFVAHDATATAVAAPIKHLHRRHSAPPVQNTQTAQSFETPAVQIAIPAESLFLPGAAPQGVVFVADLTIGPENSAQPARLQTEFMELERSR